MANGSTSYKGLSLYLASGHLTATVKTVSGVLRRCERLTDQERDRLSQAVTLLHSVTVSLNARE
jgi:hypothetical protein